MDSTERAKRAASARKSGNTSSSSSTSSNSNNNSQSAKAINLPKITETSFEKPEVVTNVAGNIDFNATTRTVDVNLPNLPLLTVDSISSITKTTLIKPIDDVRNPGFSADEKADKATFERAKNEYEDAIRYQQLLQWANNYVGEQFKTLASQAKAYTQGLVAKTEIEKVYQQFLELAKQEKITIQKGIEYIGQSHKTATIQASLPYTLAENESTLEKQRIKARKSFEEAKQSQVEFDDWFTSLKGKQTNK